MSTELIQIYCTEKVVTPEDFIFELIQFMLETRINIA